MVVLREIGDAGDNGVIFLEEDNLMAGARGGLPDPLPEVRAEHAIVQPIAIYAVFRDVIGPDLHPPGVEVGMPAVPIVVGHLPTAAAEPVRVLFDQGAEGQNAVHVDIQENPNAPPVRFRDEGLGILRRAK